MTRKIHPNELQPGDCLLYRPSSLMGWAIAVKTWTLVSHVEIYTSRQTSVASRDGKGVELYPLRTNGLAYVLRLKSPECYTFNFDRAYSYALGACGQKYDWKGLLCFTLAVKQGCNDRQFCSEFATNFYRAGGVQPFAGEWQADEVAPAQFLQTPIFERVWEAAQ